MQESDLSFVTKLEVNQWKFQSERFDFFLFKEQKSKIEKIFDRLT